MKTDIAEDIIAAEAAAWLAHLQQPDRSASADAAFQAWLADPDHARAFAKATDTWELLAGAVRAERDCEQRRSGRRALPLLAACLAIAIAIGLAVAATQVLPDRVYKTEVGEQQSFILADGTQVMLNTGSRLSVTYSDDIRRLRLEKGEAFFKVAKDAHRPLVVYAGDQQVRAVGTAFAVRRDTDAVTVVLVEGRVDVGRRARGARATTSLASLWPGQRLTVRENAGVAVDAPSLDVTLAWRRGELMFDGQPLISAVGEFNRYAETRLVVADPSLSSLPVSGVFAATDAVEFAEAMAQLYHLRTERTDGVILLRR